MLELSLTGMFVTFVIGVFGGREIEKIGQKPKGKVGAK